jgi:FkbM family methyltransferase
MSLDLADRIQSSIYYRGDYEPDVTRILLSELRAGDVFLDVGANAGYFSLLASSRCGPAGAVHAFEPASGLATQLRADAEQLPASFAAIAVHEVALLASPRTVALVEPPYARGELGERYVEDTVDPSKAVRAVGLDDLIPGLRFDVAKIDVEGAELEVIRGARDAIRRSSPRLLVVEAFDQNLARFGSTIHDLVSEMSLLGYEGTAVTPRHFAPMIAFRPRDGSSA